jgi:hypothetical protein
MSSVSRSLYKKFCEENKRLKADIWGLVNNIEPIRQKWIKTFEEEREFRMMLKDAAKKYMENNPNDPAVKFVKELNKKYQPKQ